VAPRHLCIVCGDDGTRTRMPPLEAPCGALVAREAGMALLGAAWLPRAVPGLLVMLPESVGCSEQRRSRRQQHARVGIGCMLCVGCSPPGELCGQAAQPEPTTA
jgi:hypothetical protein